MRICLRHDHNETRTHVDSRGELAIAQPFVGHALREFLEAQNDIFLHGRAPSLLLAVGPHPIADNHNFSLRPTKINHARVTRDNALTFRTADVAELVFA